MDFGLQGKVAMVAAASKGIGLAIAQELTAEGCRVSICARNEEALEAAAALIGDETRSYVVDVSDPDDLSWWHEQTVNDLGAPEILVTNTGGPPAGSIDTLTDEQWQLGFDSTVMDVVRLVRIVTPQMKIASWGRIVHLTSYVAREPSLVLPISSTLRAGLIALTKVQATELAPFGITVNGVLPGSTMTDRQTHLAGIRAEREGVTLEEALLRQGQEVPVGRLADPSEIASVVAFLCSTRASYLTGASITVDGGLSKGI